MSGCDGGKAHDTGATLNSLGDYFDHLDTDFEELQSVAKNTDNISKKNNIQLKGLKEGIKGGGLLQYLEELFMGCLGAAEDIIRITTAY